MATRCDWCDVLNAIDAMMGVVMKMGPVAPDDVVGMKLFDVWEASTKLLHTILKSNCCTCGGGTRRKADFATNKNRFFAFAKIHSPETVWRRRMAALRLKNGNDT